MSRFSDLLKITWFIILIDPLPRTQAMELFTALIELEPLVKTQKSIIDNLENYISNEKKRLNVLRKHLKHYKDEHKKAMEDVPNYLENPINSYTLIKRLTTDLDFLERKIREKTEYRRVTRMKFPTQKDLDGALQALARLQRTYKMNVTEFASGKLFGSSSSSLTSYDCYMVGMLEYKEEHFNETITWMTEALDRFKLEPFQLYNFTEVDIIEYIVYTYLFLDDVNSALEWNDKLDLNTTDPRFLNRKQLVQRHKDMKTKKEHEYKVTINKNEVSIDLKIADTFAKLCRDEVNLPANFVKRLKCRYLTEHHAFLRLAPLKMEQLFIEPDVIMIYEVMSDAVIQRLQTLAKPLLHRGEIKNVNTGQSFDKDTRIVQIAWLGDHESSMVEKVSHRVSDMTGLSSASAEFLQVANYGIGGFYEPHYDVNINKTKFCKEARTATVMFYMTNVEQGGATVFLNLGLTVAPVKGSALIWNNLLSSGNLDVATFHGACPVLHGTKWIATKWLHQRGQELIRPCGVKRRDEVSVPKHHNRWWI